MTGLHVTHLQIFAVFKLDLKVSCLPTSSLHFAVKFVGNSFFLFLDIAIHQCFPKLFRVYKVTDILCVLFSPSYFKHTIHDYKVGST